MSSENFESVSVNEAGSLDNTLHVIADDEAEIDNDNDNIPYILRSYFKLTFALDSLQGDKHMYYGRLLPTLFSLKTRLEIMQTGGFTVFATQTVPKLIEALHARFVGEYELQDSARLAVVAAVSHPQYKLRWTFNETDMQKAREIFVSEVARVITHGRNDTASSQASTSISQSNSNSHDFIILRPSVVVKDEAILFLEDTRDTMDHLASYPAVMKVFKKSNNPLCSSAPLERTFNFAGMMNNPKRGRTIPKNFENSVVLKGNQTFKKNEQEKKELRTKSSKK